MIARFTALHPYLSGISLWLLFTLIATVLWSLCKVRSSEDEDEPLVIAPPRQSSYTPPSLAKPAAKGFTRSYPRDAA